MLIALEYSVWNVIGNVCVLASLKHRRVMHYGYRFDYAASAVDRTPLARGIPSECLKLIERLLQRNLISQLPDQMTVNQYKPGQGIAKISQLSLSVAIAVIKPRDIIFRC